MSEHIEHRLTAYHDGTLGPAEAERVRAHLASCPACRLAHEDHLRFEALLHEAVQAPEPPPAFLWTRVSARLRERPGFRLSLRFAGGMALASVVGMALSFAVPPSPSPAAAAEDLWTTLDYGLADGTPAPLAAFAAPEPR